MDKKKLISALFIFGFLITFFITLLARQVYAYEYEAADIVLIGKVAQHEAGNQSDLGKRLVIDTILNRVESTRFPNTPHEVINQPGQYCNPDKYPPKWMYSLVAQEIYNRTNDQVLWYRTNKYHTYGTPLVVEGNHYFSGGR